MLANYASLTLDVIAASHYAILSNARSTHSNDCCPCHLEPQAQKTPLHNAASCGHEGCIQMLIKKGADVRAQDKVRHRELLIFMT